MIGNDIIDLDTARMESNWRRKGYLQKIFTESEQLLISGSVDPEIMVWCLWSMKEAAYKIYNRQTGIRSYMPLKLNCYDLEITDHGRRGKVSCEGAIYFTETTITKRYIHSSAVVYRNFFKQLILNIYDNNEEVGAQNPICRDEYGLPFTTDKKTLQRLPASISHHGRFFSHIAI